MRSSKPSTRRVVADDDSLSPHANQMLTRELQEVIGSDTVQIPASRADHARRRRAKHLPFVAELVDLRIGLVVTGLVLLIVVAVVAVGAGGWLVLVGAVVVLLASTAVVLFVVSRMAGEGEHVAPETAAALVAEGVGDPDRALTDLVADFTVPAVPPAEEGTA